MEVTGEPPFEAGAAKETVAAAAPATPDTAVGEPGADAAVDPRAMPPSSIVQLHAVASLTTPL